MLRKKNHPVLALVLEILVWAFMLITIYYRWYSVRAKKQKNIRVIQLTHQELIKYVRKTVEGLIEGIEIFRILNIDLITIFSWSLRKQLPPWVMGEFVKVDS